MKLKDIEQVFKDAFILFKKHFWDIMTASILTTIVIVGFSQLPTLVSIDFQIVRIVLEILNYLIGSIVMLWWVWYSLSLVKSYKTTPEYFYPLMSEFGLFILAQFLFALSLVIGTLLLIIPALWLLASLGLYTFVLIDKNPKSLKNLVRKTLKISKNQRIIILTTILLCGGINLLGYTVIYVGLLFTFPFTFLVLASTYQKIQSVHEPAPEIKPTDVLTEVPTT